MTTKLLLALSTGALFLLVACGGDDGGQGQTSSTRCDPGETKACACSATSSGTKVCGDDKHWESCQCGTVQPDVVEPGDVANPGDVADPGEVANPGDVADDTETTCTPTCQGKACGPDGCGGTCGACPQGETCQPNYTCQPGTCTPNCGGKDCGPDGCGGVCGVCEAGCTCDAGGQCQGDCGCQPSCQGRECGGDGCGGSCGSCDEGQSCDDAGQCQGGGCECPDVQCGLDACGGVCGSCPTGAYCMVGAGYCGTGGACPELLACAQACLGDATDVVTCVFDLCDPAGTNPTYTALLICVQQVCSSSFTSECAYGALETTCADEYTTCQGGCAPSCTGKQCGPDGCGGSCGSCSSGYTCSAAGKCTPETTGCGDVTFEGCCVGTVIRWCENEAVQEVDCTTNPQGSTGTKCGWDATNNFYYCVPTAAADPSGAFPYSCP